MNATKRFLGAVTFASVAVPALAQAPALAQPSESEVSSASAASAPAPVLTAELMKASEVRSIGPAAPGGRIVDVAVNSAAPWRVYAASASGGVWRSDNNGTTWSCIFDRSLSIGDIEVFGGDPDLLWVATGEANNQRSSYAGNGIWITRDGGGTWDQLGLEDSHHIARIALDPAGKNRDLAYVAVMGHLYTPNDERGLFKTTDGGKTWEKVLDRGDRTGATDVVVDPRDPNVVYASTYARTRRAWNLDDVGDAAIYKSQDGGASWRRLEGGLPSGNLGRIGLALQPSDPDLLFACIDNQNLVDVPAPKEEENADAAKKKDADDADATIPDDAKPQKQPQQPIGGEIWRSTDGGKTWEKRNEKPVSGYPPYYYGQIRIDPHDSENVWLLGIVVYVSKDGGKTFTEGKTAGSLHSDHHALWFDPDHRGRVILGNDGGLAQSYDGGGNWDYYDNLPIAQFYTVSVDLRRPYCVYGGLQDNGIWCGPSRSRTQSGTANGEWRFIGGGDGMYVLADPKDPDTVYLESQFGALQRTNTRTFDNAWIQPPHAEGDPAERYNWCSPLLLSAHNSQVVYFGSQRLWRSLDRGDHWKPVSGDLTTNDAEKLKGNVPHCTLTTISESPLDPDLMLVGSDDGNVQWTDDAGRNWTNLAGRFPDLPSHLWCSRVELSRHDKQSAWVTFNGYREDDFTPWVFRTRDGGKSFQRVVDGLPEGPVNVVHESPRKPNVLFLGSDAGAFFSIDGGDRWLPLATGLPTVSVLDLCVHPREREVVLGTHGRGFYVVDVTAHEQLGADVLGATASLFTPGDAVLWKNQWGGGWGGERRYRGANPSSGAPLWYWVGADASAGDAKPTLEVVDAKGKVVRTLEAEGGAGLHRVVWDLRFDPPKEEAKGEKGEGKEGRKDAEPKKPARRRYDPDALEEEMERALGIDEARGEPGDERDHEESDADRERDREEPGFAQDAGPRRGRRGQGGGAGELARPANYTIRLRVGERTFEQELRVVADPAFEGT
jgi:photosystem II stability/assembly factor-like uncharacterized protein